MKNGPIGKDSPDEVVDMKAQLHVVDMDTGEEVATVDGVLRATRQTTNDSLGATTKGYNRRYAAGFDAAFANRAESN